MNKHLKAILSCCAVMLAVTVLPAQAALTVIYDNGQTQSMAPYLASLQADEPAEPNANKTESPLSQPQRLGPADINNLLPVRSPGLTPGTVSSNGYSRDALTLLAQGNARPFFLVGSDAASERWLLAHREHLIHLGAVGMLVQAETPEDVQRIVDLAQGLPMTLGSATDIAQTLGISHYPVLITSKGVEQ